MLSFTRWVLIGISMLGGVALSAGSPLRWSAPFHAYLARFERPTVRKTLSFVIIASARSRLTWNGLGPNNRSICQPLLLSIFRFVRLPLSGHQAIAIENVALRLQLAAFQRNRKRPVLTPSIECLGSLCSACGLAGAGRCSMSGLTPSPAGSEKGFADSGRGYRNVMAVGEAGPLQPSRFAA